MASDDVGVSRDGLVGLVDCIAADDDCISAEPSLRVDDGVASDDYSASVNSARDVETSEENKHPSGEVALDLDGAEDADGVVDLLALGDEDVLIEVVAIAVRLSMCERRGEHKRQHSECSKCLVQQGSPQWAMCWLEYTSQVRLRFPSEEREDTQGPGDRPGTGTGCGERDGR